MWLNYRDVMDLLEVSQALAYKVIRQLQAELEQKGFLVNPNAKVPVRYFCERFGLDEKRCGKHLPRLETKRVR